MRKIQRILFLHGSILLTLLAACGQASEESGSAELGLSEDALAESADSQAIEAFRRSVVDAPVIAELKRRGAAPAAAAAAGSKVQSPADDPDAETLRLASVRARRQGAALISVDSDGKVRALHVDDTLAASIAGARAKQLPGGSMGVEGGDESFAMVPKGKSNNIENRTITDGLPDTHQLLAMVGTTNTDRGTATLFWPRLAFSSARAISLTAGTSFTPRAKRNGGAPYGTATSTAFIVPAEFTANNCHVSYTSSCVKHDWAVLVFAANAWIGNPSFMGLAWGSDAEMASFLPFTSGYPKCSSATAPPGCQVGDAYYQFSAAACNTPAFPPTFSESSSAWPWLNNTKPVMRTGCDSSPGQYGSAMVKIDSNGFGYIYGNMARELCTTNCTASSNYATSGVRLNATFGNWLTSLRTTFP